MQAFFMMLPLLNKVCSFCPIFSGSQVASRKWRSQRDHTCLPACRISLARRIATNVLKDVAGATVMAGTRRVTAGVGLLWAASGPRRRCTSSADEIPHCQASSRPPAAAVHGLPFTTPCARTAPAPSAGRAGNQRNPACGKPPAPLHYPPALPGSSCSSPAGGRFPRLWRASSG